jgi:hypothetical protein
MNVLIQAPYFNEEKLLPFFLHYYTDLIKKIGTGRIVLFDFGSYDRSKEIIENYKTFPGITIENIQMHTSQHREDLLMCVRNGYWKVFNDRFDYVFVVDIDEIIYHKDLCNLLKNKKYDIFRSIGYDISLPIIPESIYTIDNIKSICTSLWQNDALNKVSIFNPKIDVNYYWGCHSESFNEGNLSDKEITLYQFRYLGYEYFKFINTEKFKRKNLNDGFGNHYEHYINLTTEDYNNIIKDKFYAI